MDWDFLIQGVLDEIEEGIEQGIAKTLGCLFGFFVEMGQKGDNFFGGY